MAIKTEKLFPIVKSSTAIVKSAGSEITAEKKSKSGALVKQKKLSVQKFVPSEKKEEKKETYGAIIKSLTSIDKILKYDNKLDQKKFEKDRVEKEKEESAKKEKKLETKERTRINLPTISLPKLDFLDSVKRYFFFTFLGWLFTNTKKYLPQIIKIVDIIKPILSVAETIFKTLLNAFIGFIDLGYKAYDKVRDTVKNLGGEGAQKTFDELSKNLNTLITTTILVAGAIASLGEKSKKPDSPDKPPGGPKGGTPTGPRRSPITGRPVPTTSGGRTAGSAFDFRNPARQRPQITGSGGGRAGRPDLRNPLRQRPAITGSGGKPAPRLPAGKGGPGFKGLPVRGAFLIGPLLDFGIRTLIFKESPGRAAAAAVGAGIGQGIGTFIGGLGATALGLGTMGLGAVVAPLIVAAGATIGGFVGDWLGISLYDAVVSMRQNKKVERKQGGGKVSPRTKVKGFNKKRSIKISSRKKPVKQRPQRSQPGKDVGGEKKIKILYPDTSGRKLTLNEWLSANMPGTYDMYEQWFRTQSKKPNPYKALTSTSKILKEIPLIGGIMGAAVDIALGQKPDRQVFKSISSGIVHLVGFLSNQQINKNMSSLIGEINQFSDGGVIPSRQLKLNDSVSNTENLLTKVLDPMVSMKVNEALKNIQKEMVLGVKKEDGDGDNLDMTLGNIKVTSDSPDFWLLVAATLFENGKPADGYQAAADVAQAIYNRVSLPGWPKTIRGVILERGQFTPVRRYGGYEEWSKINSRESAIAFAKKYKGYTGNIVDKVAAALLDPAKQKNAKEYIGPRDNFRNAELEKTTYNHLDDSTEVTRYGHVFGFEPGGRNIAAFKKGQLKSAEINKEVVKGSIEETEKLEAMVTGGIKPSEIYMSSSQGMREHPKTGEWKYHKGIDLAGPDGSPISSAQDATVVHAGWLDDGYGYSVILRYGNGAETRFAHLKSVNVRRGQKIKAGQLIGRQGSTGVSTGSHLHFEYYPRGGAMTYSGYGDANSVKDSYFRYGGNVKPKVTSPTKSLLDVQRKIRDMKFGDPPITVPDVGKVVITKNEEGTIIKEYYDKSGNKIDSTKFFELMSNGRPQTPVPQSGPVVSSFKIGRDTYTHRQGGMYTKNGKPITKKEFDDAKASQSRAQRRNWWDNLNPFRRQSQAKPQQTPRIPPQKFLASDSKFYTIDFQTNKITDENGKVIEVSRDKNSWILRDARNVMDARGLLDNRKLQGGGLIQKSKFNLPIPNKFASYENYGQGTMIAILPIETEVMVPVPMKSGGAMIFPSSNLNIKDTSIIHSLSRG